jgi:glutamine amidotransferase
VQAIPDSTTGGERHRIPHIGWTHLGVPSARQSWSDTVLEGLGDRPAVYFVHSFTAQPADAAHRLADAWYGGRRICAAVQKDAIVGLQFHPEKSGEKGLKVIENFLAT